ncbi:hypothetical protein Nepgr_030395 [Nepenthes gracilis]|uniref:Protein LURP-one-related 15 n=1 Tax=Nepenthes gracilis TaxID=150966 RepID=A0AAD3TFQ2_NEPGR|nr:hypothetical protein Nepgr_030395 [Nepenthes gracilis]
MAGLVPGLLQMMPGQAPAQTFAPLPNPVVVVGPQFVAPFPVTLIITKKLFSMREGEFAVTDVNGGLIFTVKGSFLAIADRRLLLDAAGNPLVTLRQKLLTAHRRWQVFRGDSSDSKDLLFSAKKSSLIQFSTKLDVFLACNNRENVPDFQVKGAFRELRCTIYLGNTSTTIAQMHKHHNLQSIVFDKDTYGVTVSPNVDYAFVVALILVLHEINEDQSGQD